MVTVAETVNGRCYRPLKINQYVCLLRLNIFLNNFFQYFAKVVFFSKFFFKILFVFVTHVSFLKIFNINLIYMCKG